MKQLLPLKPYTAASFFIIILLFTVYLQAYPGYGTFHGTRRNTARLLETDTTELLTAGAWLHKKRGEKEYDSTFVRKFYFMKGGRFKITVRSKARLAAIYWNGLI